MAVGGLQQQEQQQRELAVEPGLHVQERWMEQACVEPVVDLLIDLVVAFSLFIRSLIREYDTDLCTLLVSLTS